MTGNRHGTTWRQIRARLLVNGSERPETRLESFTYERTRYSRCDTLELTLAVDRALLAKQTTKWFDATTTGSAIPPDITVNLQMRDEEHEGAQWATVFTGIVDRVQWMPTGTRIEIECRDMMAKLMDLRVQSAWLNHTAPEIVKAAIAAAGLTPNVTFSGTMSGQFWQVEHKRTSAIAHHRFQTAYDLARFIADSYGCDLYADGSTINCVTPVSADDGVVHRLLYQDAATDTPIATHAIGLLLERDYVLAKNVMVHVMSWDSRQRTAAQTWFSADGHSRTQSENGGTLYTYRFPGLRQDEVEKRAEALYNQIVAHDRRVTAQMPGIITLAPRHYMRLGGTHSSWDLSEPYAVDAVAGSFSLDGGFTQDVTLRNRASSEGANADAG